MTRREAQLKAIRSVQEAKANLAERDMHAAAYAVERFREGATISEIAAEIGKSRNAVIRRLKAAGVRCDADEKRARIASRHRRIIWTEAMVSTLVRARAERKAIAECAKLIGVDRKTAGCKARELGIGGRLA